MPQVQFIDQPSWGSALGQFGSGVLGEFTQGLQKDREQDALQNMLSDLKTRSEAGESDEDIIAGMFGAKGLPFEQKKSVADIFSQAKKNKRQLELDEEKRKVQALKDAQKEQFDREKFETSKEQKQRELDIKEEGMRIKSDSPKKATPKSEYEKTLERETAKSQIEVMKEIPKIDSAIRTADQVGALIEETTGTGSLNLRKQSELAVGSAALIEPMIKIYNPTGQVSAIKLKWINDRFGINKTDTRWTQRGKLEGIKSLLKEQRRRMDERQQLIQNWNGNPPMEKIREFDDESEKIYDAMTGWNERSAERGVFEEAPKTIQEQLKNAPKDKVIKGPEGKRYKWVKDKWVQI